jgi:hypothetical protein
VPHLTVQGADREDIGYKLRVEASGRTEAAARESAGRTRLSEDLLGEVLALRANAPAEGRHVATVSLQVPRKLRVRVEGAQGGANLEVTNVLDVHLDGLVGDVRLADIANVVAGTHRNGAIAVTGAGTVDLLLQNAHTTLENIRGDVRISARNGQTVIASPAGPVEISAQNEEVVVRHAAAAVRVTGSGGSLEIDDPRQQGYVDMRRTPVSVTLGHDAAWTILTTDSPLAVHLAGPRAIRLDAIATDGGTITAEGLGVSPHTIEQETRLTHAIGDGTIAVALRNRRGAIVIDEAK